MSEALQRLERWLLKSWRQDRTELPAFPIVATRLVDSLERPDVEMEVVEEIIAQDGSITAQVIRTANSALYGGVSEIQELRHAIVRLGFRETADIAMAAACRSLFAVEVRAEQSVYPELWEGMWQSALVGAYGARLMCNELKLGDARRVFLSAMVRDVGSLLILKLISAALVRGRLRRKPSDEQMQFLFDALHQRIGAQYLRESHMPDYTAEVAERHHAPSVPFAHDTVGLHVVRCADGLCNRLEVSPFASGEIGPAAEQSVEVLGLDENRLEYFALQFETVREQLADSLGRR